MKHIEIQNFGPIKRIDLDLDRDLQVVIGPQASGKSTFSKTVYFCRKIRDYFLQYLVKIMNSAYRYNDELYVEFLKYIRRLFMGYFGTTKHMETFRIVYYYDKKNERSVSIGLGEDHFAKLTFSQVMRNEICNLMRQVVEIAKFSREKTDLTDAYVAQTGFMERIRESVNKSFCDDDMLVYIPAGRNLLAVVPDAFGTKSTSLQDNIPDEVQIDITQIDFITQEFIKYIRGTKNKFGSKLEDITQNYLKTVKGQIRNHDVETACGLIREVLRADYVNDQDGEKLYYDDEHWVKLMFGSSGQQEIVWALNIIFLAILKNEKTFLVFEEPESHLFPDSQEAIVELVALMINSCKSQVMITTHSPYILTAANLLIFSGKEEKGNTTDAAVVKREFRLQRGKVGAHFLSKHTGKLQDIIGKQEGLIDAVAIDGISESINERMDKILRASYQNGRQE